MRERISASSARTKPSTRSSTVLTTESRALLTGDVAALARAHGPPLFRAAYRAEPQHFEVTEELGFRPSGAGEHAFLYIEKTGANTDWVARGLARHAGVRPVDVGYAGRKDRHALTRQWFSVRTVTRSVDWSRLGLEGVRVLELSRHDRKLKRGAHRANAFRITLVDVSAYRFADLLTRIDTVLDRGVPNYFGPQRFGHRNLELATHCFAGRKLRRNQQNLALSAARALIFNAILDARVGGGTWDRLVPGDLANLDGSGSVFPVDRVDAELEERLRRHDVHPTASLWGRRREPRPTAEAAAIEEALPGELEGFRRGLEEAGLVAGQRSCRVVPRSLEACSAPGRIELSFTLPAGAFATAVLREFGDVEDAAAVQPPSSST